MHASLRISEKTHFLMIFEARIDEYSGDDEPCRVKDNKLLWMRVSAAPCGITAIGFRLKFN
jgi:hypothetical protein